MFENVSVQLITSLDRNYAAASSWFRKHEVDKLQIIHNKETAKYRMKKRCFVTSEVKLLPGGECIIGPVLQFIRKQKSVWAGQGFHWDNKTESEGNDKKKGSCRLEGIKRNSVLFSEHIHNCWWFVTTGYSGLHNNDCYVMINIPLSLASINSEKESVSGKYSIYTDWR